MDEPEPVRAWAVVRGNSRVTESSVYLKSLQIEAAENNHMAAKRGEPQDYRVICVTITPIAAKEGE